MKKLLILKAILTSLLFSQSIEIKGEVFDNQSKIPLEGVNILSNEVGTVTNEDGEFIGQGGGSGVVLTNDGLIITNHHVLDMEEITIEPVNTEVRVVFEDGKMYGGEIVGSDKLTDVGLIKIGANGLSPILIGKSSKLFVSYLTYRMCFRKQTNAISRN